MDKINLNVVRETFGKVVYTHKTHEKATELCITKNKQLKQINVFLLALTSGSALGAIITPKGVSHGSLEHIMFITLTVAIDYQRDAIGLWENSRKTFEDPETSYLFDPKSLHETQPSVIRKDLQKYGLSKKKYKDAEIWRTVGVSFFKKWQGNPINFLSDCGFEAPEILLRLRSDMHLYNSKARQDYPYLRGNKIAPLWLRMLWDNVGIANIKNLDKVPIPVDIHIARATLATGIVRGRYSGSLEGIFQEIRKAWFNSVKGTAIHGRNMIALDVDEPLWHLSKFGCTYRDKSSGDCPKFATCDVNVFCVKGQLEIDSNIVRIDT